MQTATAILLLLAALWASLSAKATAFENINKRRDLILLGKLDGEVLSPEHLRLIYESDWRPLAIGATVSSALFGIVVALIPYLVEGTSDSRWITVACFVVAAYYVIAAAFTWRNMVREARLLERHLASIGAFDKSSAPRA
jgi:hypothetical protein